MHLGRPTMSLEEGKVPGQLLSVTVSSIGPFNTWQEIQRESEEKERREAALWGNGMMVQTKTNCFWFRLDVTDQCQIRQES